MKRKMGPNKPTKKADLKPAQPVNNTGVQEVSDADLERVQGGLKMAPTL